jgi:sterol desaturase/sphingolipid hydroxylase (fatty acid hydroxylase superfamily)
VEDIVTGILLLSYAALIALDFVRPARAFPRVPGWRLKGIVFFVLSVGLSLVAPLLWDDWLGAHRLIDATGLGTIGGALVGFLAVQLASYWWHRALHAFPFLFRFHQMHHSAERVDIFGAFLFHPVDVLGFTFMTGFALVMVVGVNAEAALLASSATTLIAFAQHANVRTPRWLGYIVQRPENHALHHQRGLHAYNYGDIALFDILFGTFRNPATWEGEAGFHNGASTRIGAMLLGRDVASFR